VAVLRGAIESLRAFGAVFRNPNLRRLQLGGAGSTLGIWAYNIGLGVYAYRAGGARDVGILFAARWGTAALVAPWLAVLADRRSRQRVMIGSDLARVFLLAAMAALAWNGGHALPVFALAVVTSVVSTLFAPAQGALLPSLVGDPAELTAANAAMNSITSVGMFVGPALGGVLLAVSGPAAVFVATGAAFLWSALCVLRIPHDPTPADAGEAHPAETLLAGFRAIRAHPALRLVVGLTTVQAAVCGAFEVLVVVLALDLLRSGNGTVGWLNTAVGVGCLVGVVAVAALAGRKRLAGDLGIGTILWGAPLIAVAAWTNLPFALVLMFALGLGSTIVDVAGMTLLQRSAADDVLGRVFGVLESVILASLAAGSLITPGIVSLVGARWTFVIVGACPVVVTLLAWPALRRVDEHARVPTDPLALFRTLPLFAPLPPTVLERLASSAAEVRVAAMSAAVTQGEVGDRFYVIRSGRATVEVDGAETSELGPGDFFGEIALLRDVPRTATVRALDELLLYALERDDFLAAVTGHAPSRAAADSIVSARLPAGAAV
jgi:MFS family permease